MRRLLALAAGCVTLLGLVSAPAHADPPTTATATAAPAAPAWDPVVGSGTPFIANYAATIREATPRADGITHVDTPAMIRRLQQLHVTTYWFLVWYTPTEWQDFVTEFEPAAEQAGIDIYLYLVGPTECTPVCSAPYNTDFVRWGQEIAAQSVAHPNIKGWAIDDFIYNTTLFTPQYVQQFVDAAHAINPSLRFYSQVYQNNLTPAFVAAYTPHVDGYVLAFRDDPYHNTQVTESLPGQLDADAAMVRQYGKSLVLMVYAANLSNTPMPPSASYVDTVVSTGLRYLRANMIDGLVTYVLRMDDQLESPSDFNHARTGVGALSLLDYLSDLDGGYAQASQVVSVDPASTSYGIDFAAGLHLLGNPTYGEQSLQVLVDGQVAWQVNPATLPKGSYLPEHADLTPYLSGKSSATLTLRLVTIRQAHSFYADVLLDDLTPTGFTVANAGFEDRSAWTLARNGAAYVPDYDLFDPLRARKAYSAVQAQYGPHGLVIRVGATDLPAGLKHSLEVKAQNVLGAYLAGQRPAAAGAALGLAGEARALGLAVLADQASAVADELSA